MSEVYRRFTDPDGAFARSFQTQGFQVRVLELALYAMLREQGHSVRWEPDACRLQLTLADGPIALIATCFDKGEHAGGSELPTSLRAQIQRIQLA